MHLIVRIPFDGHEIGQRITDPAHIAAILGGNLAHLASYCTKIREDAHGWTPPAPTAVAPQHDVQESPYAIHAPSA